MDGPLSHVCMHTTHAHTYTITHAHTCLYKHLHSFTHSFILFIMSYLPRSTPSVHSTVLPGAPANMHAYTAVYRRRHTKQYTHAHKHTHAQQIIAIRVITLYLYTKNIFISINSTIKNIAIESRPLCGDRQQALCKLLRVRSCTAV